jgi:hypothetical protein
VESFVAMVKMTRFFSSFLDFVAESMMAYGVVTHGNNMWRHGYLLENGFEIADTVSLLASLYPYKLDGMKSSSCHEDFARLSHPQLGIGSQQTHTSYCHVVVVGSRHLLRDGLLCFYSRNFDNEMPIVTSAFLFNVAFFLYCRFYRYIRFNSFEMCKQQKRVPLEEYNYPPHSGSCMEA